MEARLARHLQQREQAAALDQVHVFRLRDLRQAHVRPSTAASAEDRQTPNRIQWQAEHGRTHFQEQDHWR